MAAVRDVARILSFEEARQMVEDHARGLRPNCEERVQLLDSAGRILAESVEADRDFPPFPRTARDGYAVRASDLLQLPATLQVIGEIKAGATPEGLNIDSGQAVAIMTGAAAPNGADAIVMLEYTSRHGDAVEITRRVATGDNIVSPGVEARRGDVLLSRRAQLDHASIAVAASVGKTHLLVYRKPRVAVLATGDEIVDIRVQPGPNQIRNSNSYSLAAQVREAGGDPVLLPIAPDDPASLRNLIVKGLQGDLLLLAGGVSAGKYDFVERVLADLKAEFFFTGAQIQPGRPVVFGRVPLTGSANEGCYFFGLPGNPVSTMVTFELFARPLVEALAGMSARKLVFLHAKLKSDIKTKTGLKRFLPAVLSGEFEHAEVELVRWQGSGDIAATAKSNCYIVIPPDRDRIPAGEWVPVLLR